MIRLSRLSAEKATGTRTLNLHRGCFNPKLQASQRTVAAETKTNERLQTQSHSKNATATRLECTPMAVCRLLLIFSHVLWFELFSCQFYTQCFACKTPKAKPGHCSLRLEKPSPSVFASSISPIRKRPE